MTYRIAYKIGKDDHTKGREFDLSAKPSNAAAQLLIARQWKVSMEEIIVTSVTEVSFEDPLSRKSLIDKAK